MCVCEQAWSGAHCESLQLLPTSLESGYREIDGIRGNMSSWGGTVLYDPESQLYYMWASEMESHCGMHTWTTNSHIIRASSPNPLGKFTYQADQVCSKKGVFKAFTIEGTF